MTPQIFADWSLQSQPFIFSGATGEAVAAAEIWGVNYFAIGSPLDDSIGLNRGCVQVLRRGSYEIWASSYSPQLVSWLPWENDDNDLMNNLREYAEDTNPTEDDYSAFTMDYFSGVSGPAGSADFGMQLANRSLSYGTTGLWRMVQTNENLKGDWDLAAIFLQMHMDVPLIIDEPVVGGLVSIFGDPEPTGSEEFPPPGYYFHASTPSQEAQFFREKLFYPSLPVSVPMTNGGGDGDGSPSF